MTITGWVVLGLFLAWNLLLRYSVYRLRLDVDAITKTLWSLGKDHNELIDLCNENWQGTNTFVKAANHNFRVLAEAVDNAETDAGEWWKQGKQPEEET